MIAPSVDWVERSLQDEFGLRVGRSLRSRVEAAMQRVSPAASNDDRAWLERVVEHVTIHESYMFRHPAQIAAAVAHVRRRPQARVWSAACARGEEPLSFAIALGTDLPRVELFASDVSQDALACAAMGRYRPWSLRTLDATTRARCFDPVGDEFVARSAWVDHIRYSRVNLACPTTPWPSALDVAFMRNVLIYFSDAQIDAALRRLRSVLRPTGMVVVSPAEAGLLSARGWMAAPGQPIGCFAARSRAPVVAAPAPRQIVTPAPIVAPGATPVVQPLDERAAGLALARRLVRDKKVAAP